MPTIDIPRFDINKVEIHEITVWKTDIQTLMPKVLDNAMPDISGPSIPIPKK